MRGHHSFSWKAYASGCRGNVLCVCMWSCLCCPSLQLKDGEDGEDGGMEFSNAE